MEVINQFGVVIGIGSLVVTAFVYLYSTAKRGRQDVVRQDNADLRASNDTLRAEKTGLESTVRELREQNRQLRDIATQTPAVTQLIDMIKSQQGQLGEQHLQVMTGFTKLTGELSALARAINQSHNLNLKGKP